MKHSPKAKNSRELRARKTLHFGSIEENIYKATTHNKVTINQSKDKLAAAVKLVHNYSFFNAFLNKNNNTTNNQQQQRNKLQINAKVEIKTF